MIKVEEAYYKQKILWKTNAKPSFISLYLNEFPLNEPEDFLGQYSRYFFFIPCIYVSIAVAFDFLW